MKQYTKDTLSTVNATIIMLSDEIDQHKLINKAAEEGEFKTLLEIEIKKMEKELSVCLKCSKLLKNLK